MTFGQAILALRAGRRVRRASWEPGLSVALVGEALWHYAGNERPSRWAATHVSLLATDWESFVDAPSLARRVRNMAIRQGAEP